jgi:hypothetical protein
VDQKSWRVLAIAVISTFAAVEASWGWIRRHQTARLVTSDHQLLFMQKLKTIFVKNI